MGAVSDLADQRPDWRRRSQKGASVTRFDPAAGRPDVAHILASVGEAAYEWRLDSDTLSWSGNAGAVLGIDPAEVASGRAYATRVESDGGKSRLEAISLSAQGEAAAGGLYRRNTPSSAPTTAGTTWLEDTGRWFAGPDGKPLRAHGVVRAIDARHAREQRLIKLANFDPLTGEINRAQLTEVLSATLDEAVRFRSSCGFLLVSIDHLGHLNEAYGFDAAEEVIAQVAKRIRARLRGKDHLGRFSGNKFGVVLTNCTADEMAVAAERLLAGVRDETIQTAAGPVAVTVTIGGVTAPRHARTVPEVFSRALDALHAARRRRHGSFVAYRPSVERDEHAPRQHARDRRDRGRAQRAPRRARLRAGGGGEIARGRLLRMPDAGAARRTAASRRPTRSSRWPSAWGSCACSITACWNWWWTSWRRRPALQASVNVSPASTVDPNWWAGLGALLRANAGAAERLIIEITETAAIQDVDDARGFVTRVKDLGCRIAIDDFGAGHTSFRNLRKLGVDIVKIDGAFVQNMLKSSDDRAFVHTLIDLAAAARPQDRRRMGAGRGGGASCWRNGAPTICKAR